MVPLMRVHAVVISAELDQLRRRHRAGDGPFILSVLNECRIVPVKGRLNDVARGHRMDGGADG